MGGGGGIGGDDIGGINTGIGGMSGLCTGMPLSAMQPSCFGLPEGACQSRMDCMWGR